MLYSNIKKSLLSSIVFLFTLLTSQSLYAMPTDIFEPYLNTIEDELPTGLTFRLPSYFNISQHSDINPNNLIITRFGSDYPLKYNLSVFTCNQGIYTCLLASFSVERADSEERFKELLHYSRHGDPIILNPDYQGYFIRGYVIDGATQDPPSPFSSVMWQQDYMIYNISFPNTERQNLLYLAFSMAQQNPIYPSN